MSSPDRVSLLAHGKALLEKASKGEWEVRRGGVEDGAYHEPHIVVRDGHVIKYLASFRAVRGGDDNAEAVAWLRNHGETLLAEIEAQAQQIEAMRAAFIAYVEWFGAAHVDGCPKDDTCDCECKPINDAVNRALSASARGAQEP